MDLIGPAVPRTIAAFGGVTKTAKAMRLQHASTVMSWKTKEKIPSWRLRDIAEAANRESVDLPSEFHEALASEEAA